MGGTWTRALIALQRQRSGRIEAARLGRCGRGIELHLGGGQWSTVMWTAGCFACGRRHGGRCNPEHRLFDTARGIGHRGLG